MRIATSCAVAILLGAMACERQGSTAPVSPGTHVGYYVTTGGSSGGDGSSGNPWDLQTALNSAGGQVHAGDTIWVRVGTYARTYNTNLTGTAAAPIIETNKSEVSSVVNEKAIQSLPTNGRNFIDFVLTTPGVNRDVRGGDISFAGQRGTLNSLVIDGADNNNTFFGQTRGRSRSEIGRAHV